MSITTAMTGSAKAEMASGAHRFLATVTPTGTTANGSAAITAMSSTSGILQGGAISGTNIPAGAVVKSVDSTTQITISANATGAGSPTLTISYDAFKCALIKSGMAGTYGASTTNYSNVTGNSDEVSGTGYTAGGVALTNISPANSGANAYWSFGANPSWTAASFSAAGCIIYSTAGNLGSVTGRAISVHDFGGTQTVTAGTFTILLPSNAASTSVLQIN